MRKGFMNRGIDQITFPIFKQIKLLLTLKRHKIAGIIKKRKVYFNHIDNLKVGFLKKQSMIGQFLLPIPSSLDQNITIWLQKYPG